MTTTTQRATETKTFVENMVLAEEHLPALFQQNSRDLTTGDVLVSAKDRDLLQSDNPLALLSWIALRDIAFGPQSIEGLANDIMAPIVVAAVECAINEPVHSVTPRQRVGRMYLLDVQPVALPDPPMLFMLPIEPQLTAAWQSYYAGIKSHMLLLKHGMKRQLDSRLEFHWLDGVKRVDRYETTGHARRAMKLLEESLRQFIANAVGVLTRGELTYLLSNVVDSLGAVRQVVKAG